MNAMRQPPPANIAGAKSILVVDDAPFCREMTAAALSGQGFKVMSASNGIDGLKLMESGEVDLIILDAEMPVMGGIDFLKALRGDGRWKKIPVIMLTSNSSKDIITQAGKYGVSGYMLKLNFSLPTLLQRVNGALAGGPAASPAASPRPTSAGQPATAVKPAGNSQDPASAAKAAPLVGPESTIKAANLAARDKTLAAIAQLDSAKTLAGVAAEILALTEAPSTNFADLTAALRQDPILSSRVLQLANTAAYVGQKGKLTNLDDAVRNIGAANVRTIATSAGVFDAFPAGKADGLDLLRCWQHAFAVASIMGKIVPKMDGIAPGMPFLIGLCHDLGELMLRQRFPAEFTAAVNFAAQTRRPLADVFPQFFGVNFSELSIGLFERMKIPDAVSNPLKEFVKSTIPGAPRPQSAIVRALVIANEYAHGLFLTPSMESPVAPVLQTECRDALISNTPIDGTRIRAETITSIFTLAKLSAAQQAEVARPIVPSTAAAIWYVRDPSFAGIDPLETALSGLCDLKIRDRVPRANDRFELQGLVIASPTYEAAAEAMSESQAVREAGAELPVLLLTPTGQAALGHAPAGIEQANFPISLGRLAKFILPIKSA